MEVKKSVKIDFLKQGFTIIELLVVITIIGLLSSILLVGVGKARISAKEKRRAVDIRQIITALNQYYDQNGNYPCSYWETSEFPNGQFLDDLVTAGFLAKSPVDPVNKGSLIYQYSTFKTSPSGSCGQIFELDMNTESLDMQCPVGSQFMGVETGGYGHCHTFYPTPLPCSNPYHAPDPPWIPHPDCDLLAD